MVHTDIPMGGQTRECKSPSIYQLGRLLQQVQEGVLSSIYRLCNINQLESLVFFQKSCSVDSYLDEFLDLIVKAGYSDPKTIVVKFRRGLDPEIQNAIATMTSGWPSNMVPMQQPGPLTRTELQMKRSRLPIRLQVQLRPKVML